MQAVYIVSAARTPIGKFGGVLANFSPVELGSIAINATLKQAGIGGKALDLYVLGNVLKAGHGQCLARQAACKIGIPESVSGYTVDMVCASGMMSVINAATAISAGEADIVLAGGMESMSQAGFLLSSRARWGYKSLLGSSEELKDILIVDGLTDPTTGETMGEQAERLAASYDVTRTDLDEVALSSQERAIQATEKGWFKSEIAPIEIGNQIIDTDEGIRWDTSLANLAKLQPNFHIQGLFTAGNSSQISDGAAALILASEKAVKVYQMQPIARLMGGVWIGGEGWKYPEMPILAVKKLLGKLKMKIYDFDLFENNEAFALNNILFNRLLGVPEDKLNVFGGAIALGHPLGASGARIVVTLLNALQHKNASLGLASICHGTGGGVAIALERV